MISIDLTKTLSELVRENPRYVPIFQKFNIDLRFAGNLLVTEVCLLNGLSLQDLARELEGSSREAKFLDERILVDYDIPELIGYILFTHHIYLEKELSRLEELFGRAVVEDGAAHSELLEMVPLYKDFKDSMLWHMREEEKNLFPFCLQLAEGKSTSPALDAEVMESLVRLFVNEDEEIRLDLDRLREKTRSYHIPEGVGQAYRDLFHDLGQMEFELNRHVRVENQILFPKVVAAGLELLRREKEASHGVT